mmetsp:Transcript_3526/g.12325  ORF Transcript_3526/g.12325 Transcript_3526/m.12325 type:complete len:83 (-) Transcript_3526:2818-3066(-)
MTGVLGCCAGLVLPQQQWMFSFVAGDLTRREERELTRRSGGFIYVSTVSILPTLMEDRGAISTAYQVLAMCLGVYMMLLIAE